MQEETHARWGHVDLPPGTAASAASGDYPLRGCAVYFHWTPVSKISWCVCVWWGCGQPGDHQGPVAGHSGHSNI